MRESQLKNVGDRNRCCVVPNNLSLSLSRARALSLVMQPCVRSRCMHIDIPTHMYPNNAHVMSLHHIHSSGI
jgi:hypothetical protein